MSGGRELIYWDTCIWLAWFRNEKRKQGEMEGIQEDLNRFERGEILLVTSTLTLAEMLDLGNKLTNPQRVRLDRFFNRVDVIKVAADLRVTQKTQQIRDYYFLQQQKDGLPTLTIGDAIHLASAIVMRVNEFHTFDENDIKKPSRAKRGLTGLSGNVAGHNLTIASHM